LKITQTLPAERTGIARRASAKLFTDNSISVAAVRHRLFLLSRPKTGGDRKRAETGKREQAPNLSAIEKK